MHLTEAERMSSEAAMSAFRHRMRLLRSAYDQYPDAAVEALRRAIMSKALEESR